VAEAVRIAVARAERTMPIERLQRVEATTRIIQDLKSRGLLKKQEYASSSSADFERRFYVRG
jgi:hypothetical protein